MDESNLKIVYNTKKLTASVLNENTNRYFFLGNYSSEDKMKKLVPVLLQKKIKNPSIVFNNFMKSKK
jgi:hypothetical protein